jgi:tetratricopeptide (TPR) repeat protein
MRLNEITAEIQEYLDSGNRYAHQNNMGMAIYHYECALKINWLCAPVWFNLSLVFTAVGDYFQASCALQRAARLNPQNSQYWLKKGQLHYLQWDVSNALLCYEQCLRQNPKEGSAYAQAALLLNRQGTPQKALLFCQEGLNLLPQNRDLLFALAKILKEPSLLNPFEGDFEPRELELLLNLSLSKDPDLSQSYLAQWRNQLPHFPLIPLYQQALEQEELDLERLLEFFLERSELWEGQWENSVILYERAYDIALQLGDRESQRQCLELLFHSFQCLEKSSIAFHLGQHLLTYLDKEESAYPHLLNQLGILSDHLFCFSQAQELFQVASALFKRLGEQDSIADSTFNLGYSCYYEQRFSLALDILKTLSTHPRLSTRVLERIAFIQANIPPLELQGDRFVEDEQDEEALRCYTRLPKEEPRVLKKIARLYRKQKKESAEQETLKKITELSIEHYNAFDRLAELEHHIRLF